MTIQKWGGLASFLMAVSFIAAPIIYLMGNLRDAFGVVTYDIADFLYGPIISISLITVVYILREQIGKAASRRMDLALIASILAVVGIAGVAFIRAANRHYHILHPDLHLEGNQIILIVWETLVSGVNSIGFHFLGWTYILLGSALWTSRFFPRGLSGLYLFAGVLGLFVYLFQDSEFNVLLLGTIINFWQGILFLKTKPEEKSAI